MRISLTPRSSSVCDTLDEHSFRLDDSGNGDHVVPAHDERPRLACGTGDLRVDEHVLDLLRSPGEPIAGTPGSYLKAWELRGDPPLAPTHLAAQSDGRLLDPDTLVLAHRGQAAAEIESLRSGRRGEQLVERGRPSASRSRLRSAPGCSSRRRGKISSRISPRFVSRFDSSVRNSIPSARQYASVSSRHTVRSGRTTPSSRCGLMPFAAPLATSR